VLTPAVVPLSDWKVWNNGQRYHPSYSRLSRYDETGLVWLLQGRPVAWRRPSCPRQHGRAPTHEPRAGSRAPRAYAARQSQLTADKQAFEQ
jgi:hypothetical protein